METERTTDALADEFISSARGVPSALRVQWMATWRWVLALAVIAGLARMTYAGGGWTPLLSAADLGFHEFGHMIFMWAPRLIVAAAGSFVQVAVPVGLAVYFWRFRRDQFAGVLMLAWGAESLNNVSVYVYDATRLVLPLFGDMDGTKSGHDWAYILGAGGLNVLNLTDPLAYTMRAASVAMFVFAAGAALFKLLERSVAARAAAVEAAHVRTLPVRTPEHRVELRPRPEESDGRGRAAGEPESP